MQLLNGVRNCLMLISRLLPKRLAHPICHSVASFSKRASRRAIKMASTDSAAEVLHAVGPLPWAHTALILSRLVITPPIPNPSLSCAPCKMWADVAFLCCPVLVKVLHAAGILACPLCTILCASRVLRARERPAHLCGALPSTAQADLVVRTLSPLQATLQQAIVKSAPSDDHLQIALVLAGKRRLMDRPKSEALQKTLARMQKNAMPPTGAASSE